MKKKILIVSLIFMLILGLFITTSPISLADEVGVATITLIPNKTTASPRR